MTSSTVTPQVPEWDLADRMAKSLRTAGLSKHDMAEYFGVHRNTVSGWIHGRIRPDTRTLRLWAMRTNVPYEWLRGDQLSKDDEPVAACPAQAEPQTAPVSPLFLAPKSDDLPIPAACPTISAQEAA